MASRLLRLLKHRRLDEGDARRALGAGAPSRIAARVASSEALHTGQIRVCIEAGLPLSYLRRAAPARERAVTMFGKLGVWDTEHNNGVLLYVLLAEQAIEIVADRGLARRGEAGEWERIAAVMGQAFRAGRFEDGVNQGIDAVGALLQANFERAPGQGNPNELPDEPMIR